MRQLIFIFATGAKSRKLIVNRLKIWYTICGRMNIVKIN